VGSNQSIAFPLVVMNCILAESLAWFADQVAAETAGDPEKLNDAIQKALQAIALEHSAVVFGGNGYSQEWHDEAAKRGLPNLRNTVEALPAMIYPDNIDVLGKFDVLSEREVRSRYTIALEKYCLDINTEAMLALEIAKTKILPAALTYQGQLATLALQLQNLGKTPSTALLDEVIGYTTKLEAGIAALQHALEHDDAEELTTEIDPEGVEEDEPLTHAKHYRDDVIPAMLQIREAADALEGIVADELWPLPTYQEMLFIK